MWLSRSEDNEMGKTKVNNKSSSSLDLKLAALNETEEEAGANYNREPNDEMELSLNDPQKKPASKVFQTGKRNMKILFGMTSFTFHIIILFH